MFVFNKTEQNALYCFIMNGDQWRFKKKRFNNFSLLLSIYLSHFSDCAHLLPHLFIQQKSDKSGVAYGKKWIVLHGTTRNTRRYKYVCNFNLQFQFSAIFYLKWILFNSFSSVLNLWNFDDQEKFTEQYFALKNSAISFSRRRVKTFTIAIEFYSTQQHQIR